MWVRADSSRTTRRFSVMIWSSFRTVVYPVSRPRTSVIWRTVLGPRVHKTRRMPSSASVGLRRSGFMAALSTTLFVDVNTKAFVGADRGQPWAEHAPPLRLRLPAQNRGERHAARDVPGRAKHVGDRVDRQENADAVNRQMDRGQHGHHRDDAAARNPRNRER